LLQKKKRRTQKTAKNGPYQNCKTTRGRNRGKANYSPYVKGGEKKKGEGKNTTKRDRPMGHSDAQGGSQAGCCSFKGDGKKKMTPLTAPGSGAAHSQRLPKDIRNGVSRARGGGGDHYGRSGEARMAGKRESGRFVLMGGGGRGLTQLGENRRRKKDDL